MGRRTLPRPVGAALLVAGLLGAASATAGAAAGTPALTLTNTHTGETLAVGDWRQENGRAATLAAVSHVLRDHRNGKERPMDAALLDLLVEVAAACGQRAEFTVISGYRSPESNAAMHARSAGVAAHSLHVQGKAIDVRLKGCALEQLRDAGLALRRGGVGYYPGPDFVHLDTGRVRQWSG